MNKRFYLMGHYFWHCPKCDNFSLTFVEPDCPYDEVADYKTLECEKCKHKFKLYLEEKQDG